MNYEALLIEAEGRDLIVKEKPLQGSRGRIKGNRIAIRESMTTVEKACVLEEEIAHHDLTVGRIIDQSVVENRKQEHRARMLAYYRRCNPNVIADALRAGHRSLTDIAEHIEVTEEFLVDAIEGYRQKYGLAVQVGEDLLMLEPVALLRKIT